MSTMSTLETIFQTYNSLGFTSLGYFQVTMPLTKSIHALAAHIWLHSSWWAHARNSLATPSCPWKYQSSSCWRSLYNAIIVEDPDDFCLPNIITNAQEVLFLAHYWHMDELDNVVSLSGDTHCSPPPWLTTIARPFECLWLTMDNTISQRSMLLLANGCVSALFGSKISTRKHNMMWLLHN